MSKLHSAIIGYGVMGKIREKSILNNPNLTLKYIYDPECQNTNNKFISDVNEIINDKSIQIIFICTPNHLNFDFTKLAILNGKNVFCEKPPTLTMDQMLEIIQLEKKFKIKLMYGLNHRQHQSVITMKEKVESNEFGKILWMRGRYGKSVDETFSTNWRCSKKLSGGGILFDQGIHMLDLMYFLVADLEPHGALLSNNYWKIPEMEDNAFVTLYGKDSKVSASIHSTMTQWRHLFSLEVFLERGYMTINGLKTNSGSYGNEVLTIARNRSIAPRATWESEEDLTFEVDNFWDKEVNYFVDQIIYNRPIEKASSQDALRLMKGLTKIYEIGWEIN